jgi:FixJ family two-component response regulator
MDVLWLFDLIGAVTAGLSGREAQVVRLVAQGLSNAQFARRLVISTRTVTDHLQHVYARPGRRITDRVGPLCDGPRPARRVGGT